MSTQQARVYNGRYEMLRHIARGGMAEVYLARDLLLDRPVALKVLFPELSIDRSFVERFRREAQAAANLSHQNIVSVYDWGEEDNTYFIVMEFIDGRPLSQVIRSEGRLLPDRAAQIGADVAAALAFAHRHGVVHRDVKPGNVLIDSHGAVKVTDFGIARGGDTKENLTQAGSVMGTATYFSPEQAQGLPTDPRSDVYSLGVVLFEMVTGKPPFTGENPLSIAYKHVREVAPRARQIEPAVPAAFEAIISRAMAKPVGERYTSAEELRADLLRFTRGQAPLAARAGTTVLAAVPGADRTAVLAPAPVNATTAMPVAAPAAYRAADAEPEVVEERPPRTGAFVGLFVLLLAVLLILLFLLGRMIGLFGGSGGGGTQVNVPSVVNETVAVAQAQLQGLGFKVVVNPANVDPASLVATQAPAGNTKAKSGSTITLTAMPATTTSTLAQVPVPSVVGQTQAAAESTLQQAGLTVGTVTQQPSATVSAGVVISNDPVASTNVAPGSAVNLVVSSGKGTVTPNVVGEPAAQAVADLKAAGYTTVSQTPEGSTTIPSGSVIRSTPSAGGTIPKSKSATIVVSSGPQQVTVPSVVGQTQGSATAALKAKGLQVQTTPVNTTNSSQIGRVVSQSPGANVQVASGSTVVISVGRSAASSTSSISSTTSTTL